MFTIIGWWKSGDFNDPLEVYFYHSLSVVVQTERNLYSIFVYFHKQNGSNYNNTMNIRTDKKKVSLLSREDYSVSREVQAEGVNEICILMWSHWVTDLFSSVLHHQPLLVPLITQWEMFCWKWIINSIRKRCFITHTSNVRSLFPSPLLQIKISLYSKRNHFQQQVF